MNNKRTIGIVGGVILALAVAGAGLYALNTSQPSAKAPASTSSVSPSPSNATAQTLNYPGVEGKTALELLKAKDPKAMTKGEGTNAYVTTINGYTASDTKKEFWAFYVNGKSSEVGAGSYVTKAADQIEWKLETY